MFNNATADYRIPISKSGGFDSFVGSFFFLFERWHRKLSFSKFIRFHARLWGGDVCMRIIIYLYCYFRKRRVLLDKSIMHIFSALREIEILSMLRWSYLLMLIPNQWQMYAYYWFVLYCIHINSTIYEGEVFTRYLRKIVIYG